MNKTKKNTKTNRLGKVISFISVIALGIAFMVSTGLIGTASATISVEKIEFLTDTPEPEFFPVWTADGSQIMYLFQRVAWSDRDSYIMNADGSDQRRTYIGEDMLSELNDLSPDGTELLISKCFGYFYDVYKVNVSDGTLTPLATNSLKIETSAYWSPDGTKIAYDQDDQLWVMDSDGSNKQRLGTSYKVGPKDWSPDGSKIIYCASDGDNELDLWMIDPDGTNQVQITDTPYHEWWPSFSPDGQYIVYVSGEGDTPDLWLRNVDGSYKVRLTYNLGIHDASPHWSPDGRKIVFVGNQGYDHADIAVMTLGETPIPATIDMDPDTLNLKSKGNWITAYIELPEGYDVADIDVSKVLLEDTIAAEADPTEIGDCDADGITEIMVKFDRAAIQGLLEVGDGVVLTVTGELTDGTAFEGSDTICVIDE